MAETAFDRAAHRQRLESYVKNRDAEEIEDLENALSELREGTAIAVQYIENGAFQQSIGHFKRVGEDKLELRSYPESVRLWGEHPSLDLEWEIETSNILSYGVLKIEKQRDFYNKSKLE